MRTGIGFAIVAGLALTGCSAEPPPAPGTETAPEGGSAPITTAECLVDRVWNLDVQDLGQQLREQLEETGMPILNIVADGEMTLVFYGDGIANTVGDVTFAIAIQPDDSPSSLLDQRQYGSGVGPWEWEGPESDVVLFSDWESDWVIEAEFTVGGTSLDAPFELPPSFTEGEAMTVSCVGDTLITFTEGNPFVRYWTASE